MKKSSLIIIVFVGIICFILSVIWFGIKFSPGSYSNVEKYEFNVSEQELINYINKLKNKQPNLKVPIDYNFEEGRSSEHDHWYHFYIFYSEEKEIVYCWVRASSRTSTKLALVSIMDKQEKWKTLNKDFNSSESRNQKIKFEERFVNKLKKMINEN
jgi:hypothetical protein